ncbi:hypothetical protein CDG79_32655 [Nostoc sp. 'Peltigera membranacea cyanobiont' 232]|nr:hypothetical protein CDG79_32655 [Nostoc sp. 'Peltigera membranacea cyanobiont' 232]
MSGLICQDINPSCSPFKVVKFGTKINDFNLQKAQNLSGELRIIALKQGIFVERLERASPSCILLK